MEEFKQLWEDVLTEIVLPRGYLNKSIETMDDQILISKAFQYCIIMRTKEGLTEYLDYHGNQTEFFKKKIIELLSLEELPENIRERIIRNYLKEKIIDNGFICHTTNNISAEAIMNNGFTNKETDGHTQDVIEELKEIFPEGFFKTDLNHIADQKERTGWFYDRSPYHYKRYSNGPEWFKRLVSSRNYVKRDYEASKNFIMNTMDYYQEPLHKKQQALNFLNKYWNIYAPTTPHMLLISTKNNDLRNPKEVEVVDTLEIDEQIQYYIELYFKGTDQNTDKEVLPSQILDFDMKELEKKMYNGYQM